MPVAYLSLRKMKLRLRLFIALMALVLVFSIPGYIVVDIADFLWTAYPYLTVALGGIAAAAFTIFLYTSREIRGRGKTAGLSGVYLLFIGMLYVASPTFSETVLGYLFSTILFVFAVGYDISRKRYQAWVAIIPLLTISISLALPVISAYFMMIGIVLFGLAMFYEFSGPKPSTVPVQQVAPKQASNSPSAQTAAKQNSQPPTPAPARSSPVNTSPITATIPPSQSKMAQTPKQPATKNDNQFGYKPAVSQPSQPQQASFKVIKTWPSQGDYQRAFQNLKFSISAKYPDIKAGKVLSNPNVNVPGNIVYSSGNYGTIFKMDVGGLPYAIKCFTKSSQDIQRRYYEISRYLKEIQGKYNIEALKNFQYLNQCVRTMKDPSFFYPVLKMDWIEGSVLNSFITANVKKQSVLKNLAQQFLETSAKLHRLGISHGDLAGDNIIVTPKDSIALIDYDGMYVPAFRGEKAPEKGHEHFQHPDRSIIHFSEDLDNFSSLIIYTSLLAVSSKPELWNRYNKGDYDCLVFRHNDFRDPGSSPLIGELTKQNGIVGKLSNLVYKAIDHEPLWDQISPERILKV